jgi:hypothetical protein
LLKNRYLPHHLAQYLTNLFRSLSVQIRVESWSDRRHWGFFSPTEFPL